MDIAIKERSYQLPMCTTFDVLSFMDGLCITIIMSVLTLEFNSVRLFTINYGSTGQCCSQI